MQPTIQYVASAGGTTIAYPVVGKEPPLLFVRGTPDQLDLDLTITTVRRALEPRAPLAGAPLLSGLRAGFRRGPRAPGVQCRR